MLFFLSVHFLGSKSLMRVLVDSEYDATQLNKATINCKNEGKTCDAPKKRVLTLIFPFFISCVIEFGWLEASPGLLAPARTGTGGEANTYIELE